MITTFFKFSDLPCRTVERALLKLGFTEDKNRGTSHRQFRKLDTEGHLRKVTLDCHKGVVSAPNVRSIIKQANVSKEQFYKAANS